MDLAVGVSLVKLTATQFCGFFFPFSIALFGFGFQMFISKARNREFTLLKITRWISLSMLYLHLRDSRLLGNLLPGDSFVTAIPL